MWASTNAISTIPLMAIAYFLPTAVEYSEGREDRTAALMNDQRAYPLQPDTRLGRGAMTYTPKGRARAPRPFSDPPTLRRGRGQRVGQRIGVRARAQRVIGVDELRVLDVDD